MDYYKGEAEYSDEEMIKHVYNLFWNGLDDSDKNKENFFWNVAYVLKNDKSLYFLAACGDSKDGSSPEELMTEPENESSSSANALIQADALDDLRNCTSKSEGDSSYENWVIYVPSSSSKAKEE